MIFSISSSLLLENSFFLYFIISDVHWGFDMLLDARHFGCPSSEFRFVPKYTFTDGLKNDMNKNIGLGDYLNTNTHQNKAI